MKWIRLWTDEVIKGTTFSELNLAQRGLWWSLLLLAGDSLNPGIVECRKDEAYGLTHLSFVLNCDVRTLKNALGKLVLVGKITYLNDGRIQICNWQKYQTRYQKYYKKEDKDKQDNGIDMPEDNGIGMPGRLEGDEEEDKLSKKKAAKLTPSSKHFSNNISEKYLDPLLDIAKKIQVKSNGQKGFNFYKWIQAQIKKKAHPGAMLKVGTAIYELWDNIDNPWAYAESVMKIQNGNFNERDRIEAHEAMKAEWQEWEKSPAAKKLARLLNADQPRGP